MFALWRQRPVLVSLFVLASMLTVFFGARFVGQALYWADPAHHHQRVEGWMTVGYIARSWHLEARDLDKLADLPGPKAKNRPQPLSEIAADRGVPLAELIAEVEAAIATLDQAKPAK